MTRASSKLFDQRRALAASVVLLLVLCLAPIRFTRWVGYFGSLAQTIQTPISDPLNRLGRWLAPAGPRFDSSDAVAVANLERERYEAMYLQQLEENQRLRRQVQELQRGVDLYPELPVRQLLRPVTAASSDLSSGILWVRAGSRDGVTVNAVATVRGTQLLGRVVGVTDRLCKVQPIIDRAAGRLRARVMFEGGSGLECLLGPTGQGTLRGEVEYKRDPVTNEPVRPAVGQIVRLTDPDAWAPSAQMLIVGEVESVEPSPADPQRSVIVVRPTIPRLDRVSEVVLRIVAEDPQR